MIKIVISTATTLMAAAVLVACNGDGVNSNDVTSTGASPVSKAVCTSSNNWQSVGIGMSASQVEARLGKPARIDSAVSSVVYHYERCRGGYFLEKAGTPATGTTPAVRDEYMTYYSSGSLVISSGKGVLSTTPPVLRSDKPMDCEWDFYNYPTNYGNGNDVFVCRNSSNPF